MVLLLEEIQYRVQHALANISIIEEEKLVERSEKVGADIVKRLQHSIGHLPAIKEVRGIGMMIGIEFHVETAAAYVPVIKSKALEKKTAYYELWS